MNDVHPIKACTLYERTSEGGRRYFVGRMGGLRVLIFRDGDEATSPDSQPLRTLCLAAAPEKPADESRKSQTNAHGGRRGEIRAQPRGNNTKAKRFGPEMGNDPETYFAG